MLIPPAERDSGRDQFKAILGATGVQQITHLETFWAPLNAFNHAVVVLSGGHGALVAWQRQQWLFQNMPFSFSCCHWLGKKIVHWSHCKLYGKQVKG